MGQPVRLKVQSRSRMGREKRLHSSRSGLGIYTSDSSRFNAADCARALSPQTKIHVVCEHVQENLRRITPCLAQLSVARGHSRTRVRPAETSKGSGETILLYLVPLVVKRSATTVKATSNNYTSCGACCARTKRVCFAFQRKFAVKRPRLVAERNKSRCCVAEQHAAF